MLCSNKQLKMAAVGIALTILILLLPSRNSVANRTVVADVDCIVQPSIVTNLGVASPGLISKLHYERADFVSKGEILAELDSELEGASLVLANHRSQSTAALELRRRNAEFTNRTLQRNQSLYEKASVSGQTLDQIKTEVQIASLQQQQEQENLKSARLEASRAQIALDRRFIISPFEGAITERYKSVGEYVADEPVFQLVQLDPLRIEMVLLIEHLNTVEVGMPAAVHLLAPGFEDKTLAATVRRIDPVADAASGTYGVWAELSNPDLTIPSGVRCKLDLLSP